MEDGLELVGNSLHGGVFADPSQQVHLGLQSQRNFVSLHNGGRMCFSLPESAVGSWMMIQLSQDLEIILHDVR